MHVFDRFEDTELIAELLKGMYAELPETNGNDFIGGQISIKLGFYSSNTPGLP